MTLQRSGAPSHQHLLLVEDEPTLARVLALVLTSAGYRVTTCADGADALQTFRASPESVDVVLSDVTIPALSGDRLARALLEIRPNLPVILMTGYSNLATPHHARALGVSAVLGKPIDVDDLLAAVESASVRPAADPRSAPAARARARPSRDTPPP